MEHITKNNHVLCENCQLYSSPNKSLKAHVSVLQECAGEKTLDLHLKNEMQILNFKLRVPCQKTIPYDFLIAAKTPEAKYLPAFGHACSPVKLDVQRCRRGLWIRGEKSLWVKFSLQCGLFCVQEVSYNISVTNWNCLQLPLPFQLWCFFPLDIVLVVCIPHLVVAVTRREECWVFTTPLTAPPSLWELSLQQKVWRIGKETCSHPVQLWKLLWMQIISSFIESIFC